ncbi:HupE/UreJ family protein [Eoetvoesiella caeni]|uniref:Urease accessory protein n=1 Tax=Eoetvoesiella caeni TaxID=645616 RepID=A0A366HH49_9BURK|nr:HupE/UreJ family protein [Eoetvoesiella caeni]MCI2808063.1 HupE/UreJ family protein [Eoetvoesiella caeni]NYT53934.1 HupE/UreJ family protein [Eoetvoesiella caeni]RBP41983.1 urease accessory protein [Eoetvoesiella caeni]
MSIPTLIHKASSFLARACIPALVSGAALAHPGHEVSANMFISGLVHPLTGVDHLLAMLAVGLWSALSHQTMRQALWTPACFLCLLLVGALAGMAGLHLPAVEPVIVASLLVLGLLVASRTTLPAWAGAALVGFFALFHGMAHGAELPQAGSPAYFIAGFMLATLALHLVGLFTGFSLKQRSAWLTRIAGTGIAAYGVALLAVA